MTARLKRQDGGMRRGEKKKVTKRIKGSFSDSSRSGTQIFLTMCQSDFFLRLTTDRRQWLTAAQLAPKGRLPEQQELFTSPWQPVRTWASPAHLSPPPSNTSFHPISPTPSPPIPNTHKRFSVAASAPLLAARPTFLQLPGRGPSLCLSNTRPAEQRDNV